MTREDAHFMRLALRLGRRGLGRTSPNPAVGALVVRQGKVVGRGFHRRAGEPHAEVVAVRVAGARTRGATLYVTLEPCSHFGRTPPCTEALKAAGIARVVVGTRDPNPTVGGGGVAKLRRAGIEVVCGVEQAKCDELIAAFRKHVTSGLPLVTLKLAASLDGRIATGDGQSKWITGKMARGVVQTLRNEHDAILVGIETVLRDDPALTCRIRGGRDPLRVILDTRLRIPEQARVLTNGAARGTLLATSLRRGAKLRRLRAAGVQVLTLPRAPGGLPFRGVLKGLGRRGVSSVLIEGGAAVAASALKAGLVDRLVLFYAPKVMGGDGRPMIAEMNVRVPSRALTLGPLTVRHIGDDLMVTTTPAFGSHRQSRRGAS